jgi:hypothetical protein
MMATAVLVTTRQPGAAEVLCYWHFHAATIGVDTSHMVHRKRRPSRPSSKGVLQRACRTHFVDEAAFSMIAATSTGLDSYTAWLPGVSTTAAPARVAIAR